MGNVYMLGKCPECNEIIEITEINTVMVHGSDNHSIALSMLKKGLTIEYIKSKFCGNCGGFIPCGCGDESPQA